MSYCSLLHSLPSPHHNLLFESHLFLFLVTQSCQTLGDPMDWSLPSSSIQGILQARILEWMAMPFSRDLPDPGTEPHLLHGRQSLYCLSHQRISYLDNSNKLHLPASPLALMINCPVSRQSYLLKMEMRYHLTCILKTFHLSPFPNMHPNS